MSITQASDRILIHCFAGCGGTSVMAAMGLTMADLFVTASDPHTAYRQQVRHVQELQRKARRDEVAGFTLEALREVDYFTRSRQGLDIAQWSHDRLHDELDALSDAYALLWAEELAQWT